MSKQLPFHFTISHNVRACIVTLSYIHAGQHTTLTESKLPSKLAGNPNKLIACPFWQRFPRTSHCLAWRDPARTNQLQTLNSGLPSWFSVSSRKERIQFPNRAVFNLRGCTLRPKARVILLLGFGIIRKERIQFPNQTVSTRGGTSSGRSSCFTSEAKP